MNEQQTEIHIHLNNLEQKCLLKDTIKPGQTAIVHFHEYPDDCNICPNGHCHAPNVSVSILENGTIFFAFESFNLPDTKCEIVDLPPHQIKH